MSVVEQDIVSDKLSTPEHAIPPCPPWCTVNHSAGLARMEERDFGERVHGVHIGSVGDASVWVNRVDTIAAGVPGPLTLWAESEGEHFDSQQSIEFAKAVMRALAMVEGR